MNVFGSKQKRRKKTQNVGKSNATVSENDKQEQLKLVILHIMKPNISSMMRKVMKGLMELPKALKYMI